MKGKNPRVCDENELDSLYCVFQKGLDLIERIKRVRRSWRFEKDKWKEGERKAEGKSVTIRNNDLVD